MRYAAVPGIVTPEAVRLEFSPAGIGSRCLALMIDFAILGTAVFALLVAVGLSGLPASPLTIGSLVLFLLLLYPALFEVALGGRTPGKAALGVRVVTREGAPIGLRHAALRAALGLVDFYLTVGGAAVVSALATRQSQRLGDLVAGTLVLRERGAGRTPGAVRFTVPAGFERYAETLDPGVLWRESYEAVRAFLLRAHELAPPARRQLARRLADPLALRLGHRPPPGTTPELFLLCLVARYQERARRQPPGYVR